MVNPSLIAFYWLMATARCQDQNMVTNYVYGCAGKEADVSWTIPDTTENIVYIKQILENGTQLNAVFIREPSKTPRLTVTTTLESKLSGMFIEGRAAKLMFTSLKAEDAGEYRCMGTKQQAYSGCAVNLVVVGEPLTPTIKLLNIVLLKETALFECVHRSTTKPTRHGLETRILWQGNTFKDLGDPPSAKFSINERKQLMMHKIARSDRGRKITCTTSDIIPGRTAKVYSQRSEEFTVMPEYPPEEKDITLTTDRDGRTTVYLNDNDTFTCRCQAHCEPACSIQWSFRGAKADGATNITDLADPQTLVVIVGRKYQGAFQCTASNKHGSYTRELTMVVHYLSQPVLYINGRPETEERVPVMEQEEVEVKCTTDSVPTPIITLKSDDVKLLSVNGKDPIESRSPEGYLVHEYIVSHKVRARTCEHPNELECTSDNHFGLLTKKTEMYVQCSPSRAVVDDLELYEEYTYELHQRLTFSFVIRAVPDPVVTSVKSSLNGDSRTEEMPSDVEIVNEGKYESKNYLTQFIFTCRRKLEAEDSGRIFTLVVEAGTMTEEIKFIVQLAGQVTLPNTAITDVSQKTQRIPRRQPRRPPKKVQDGSSLFAWLAIGVLALALGIIIVVALYILKKKSDAAQFDDDNIEQQFLPEKQPSGSVKESKIKIQSSKTSTATRKSEVKT